MLWKTKRPFRIRSVCWEGENTSRTMGNQVLMALGSWKKFNKRVRMRRTSYGGRPIEISVHGVWKPVAERGGLGPEVLRETDLLLVPSRSMFTTRPAPSNTRADLWRTPESISLIEEHQRNGRILFVPENVTSADLRAEIARRIAATNGNR